ncbi:MAG TPA: hypothetical protein VNH22_11555 [Blastocatellia bacterium]|jgi:hypothetical protein|nr:hypothetical protein [Blastocatellia bacterium]
MKLRVSLLFLLLILCGTGYGRGQKETPSATVINFYRALKARQYVEGFRHSVYKAAVEGLTPAELKDLEPDFGQAFSGIPDKLDAQGEQITGDTATVFLKFEGNTELQPVALIRSGGEWLVGDKESLDLVQAQGRSFFFNTRILVNEREVYEAMQRIVGAEVIYSGKFEGRCASMPDLIRLGALSKDYETMIADGYRFDLTIGSDQKSFVSTATPLAYGKTGKLSFFADINGIRAEDLKGQPASARSPVYQPR